VEIERPIGISATRVLSRHRTLSSGNRKLRNPEIGSESSVSWDMWARLGAHRHIRVRRFVNPKDKAPEAFEIVK
jgi:hypothetical protein